MTLLVVHPDENKPEVRRAREEAGLKYVGSLLLKSDSSRDRCFYDNTPLEKRFNLSIPQKVRTALFVCPECDFSYELPA